MKSNASVDEMSEPEHRQTLERHEIFEQGVDTDAALELARSRRDA